MFDLIDLTVTEEGKYSSQQTEWSTWFVNKSEIEFGRRYKKEKSEHLHKLTDTEKSKRSGENTKQQK